LREGASTPIELLNRAAELGYDSLALTDHDGLYGAMEFAREAALRGIRPITGAEVTLQGGYHLTLLAESPRGYANLCRLISHGLGTPLDQAPRQSHAGQAGDAGAQTEFGMQAPDPKPQTPNPIAPAIDLS